MVAALARSVNTKKFLEFPKTIKYLICYSRIERWIYYLAHDRQAKNYKNLRGNFLFKLISATFSEISLVEPLLLSQVLLLILAFLWLYSA